MEAAATKPCHHCQRQPTPKAARAEDRELDEGNSDGEAGAKGRREEERGGLRSAEKQRG